MTHAAIMARRMQRANTIAGIACMSARIRLLRTCGLVRWRTGRHDRRWNHFSCTCGSADDPSAHVLTTIREPQPEGGMK